MRLGCLGCLGLLVVLALAVGAGTLAYRVLAPPPEVEETFTVEDGLSAQRKLAEILLREARVSRRQTPVVLTEPEINAFLARHLEGRRLQLRPLQVRLSDGVVEIWGGLPLGVYLQDSPLAGVRPYLPLILLRRKLWLTVRGRLQVDGQDGEFRLEGWALGRQSLPVWLSGLLPGRPASDLFRWRVPEVVDRVVVDDGRLVVHTRPPRRSAAGAGLARATLGGGSEGGREPPSEVLLADELADHLAAARSGVEVEEHDLLPGAEE